MLSAARARAAKMAIPASFVTACSGKGKWGLQEKRVPLLHNWFWTRLIVVAYPSTLCWRTRPLLDILLYTSTVEDIKGIHTLKDQINIMLLGSIRMTLLQVELSWSDMVVCLRFGPTWSFWCLFLPSGAFLSLNVWPKVKKIRSRCELFKRWLHIKSQL